MGRIVGFAAFSPGIAVRVALVVADLARRTPASSVAVATADGLLRRGHALTLFAAEFDPALWPEAAAIAPAVQAPPARAVAWREFELVHPHGLEALRLSSGCGRPRLWFCHEFAPPLPVEATHRELVLAAARPEVDQQHPALRQCAQRQHEERRWWRRLGLGSAALAGERAAVAALEGVLVSSGYGARCFRHAYGRVAEVMEPGAPEPSVPEPAQRRGLAVWTGSAPEDNAYGVAAALDVLRRDRSVPAAALEPSPVPSARLLLYLPLCAPSGWPAIEALLAGTPVLAADHGGGSEVVVRSGGGEIVDPLLPEAIAAALRRLLPDDAGLRRLGQAGRTATRALFGLEAYLDRLERAMRRAAGREAR